MKCEREKRTKRSQWIHTGLLFWWIYCQRSIIHYLQSCQLSQYRFRESSILIIFLHFLQLDVLLIRAKRQVRSQARPVPDPDLGSVFETYFEWPTCNSNQKDYVNSKIRLLIDTSRHWRTSIKRFLKLVHLLRSIKWLLDKTMTKHIYLKSFLLVLNG